MRKYRRLWHYPLQQWPTLLLILVFSCLASGVAALQPWPMKVLIDHALGDGSVPAMLRMFPGHAAWFSSTSWLIGAAALGSLCLYVLNSALDVGLSWSWTAAGQRMVYRLAADMFRHLQRLSLQFHTRRGIGDSLSRLSGDTWCVYTGTSQLLIQPLKNVLTLITIGTVAWRLNPELALLSLLMAPLLGGSGLYFGRRLKNRTLNSRKAESRLLGFVHQTLTAIPVVQAFATEQRNGRRFQQLAADAVGFSQRGTLVKSSFELVNELIVTAGTAVVLFVAGRQVLSGVLTIGSLVVFLAYLRSLQLAAKGLLSVYGSMRSLEANVDRILEVLDAAEGVRDLPGAKDLPVSTGARGIRVSLEGVTFGYEGERAVLQEVNLEAQPGETVALVGATGAGKSTLVFLLPRFFDPWRGCVRFDGVDVREVTLASLRRQIALVLQEPFLLPLSIAANIAYGRPGASRGAIEAAARAANASAFIERLPQGYETVLGERGASLSGGERQRLSIARALLKDAPVLILDEPTSALDAATEALLLEALERLMQGRTTFIIAHRLSTIRNADRIVVLDRGRIVETGTHRELLEKRGDFHRLHIMQGFPARMEGVA